MSTRKRLIKLEKQRALILTKFQDIDHMIRGTYVETTRKCGKPTCRCLKDNKGHPSYQISWTKDSKSRTKAIPKEDITWIKEMTENYRGWRKLRANLRLFDQELKYLLDKWEDKIIRKTGKLRKYF